MARNDRVLGLREQALRLERNAGKKMSRLRAQGVELSGTAFDARRGAGDISRMRSRDLEVHIRRMTEFTSRRTRFMQTEEGPVSGELVNRLGRAQRRVNRQREAMQKRYGKIKSPLSDENMNQRWAVEEKTQRQMNDPSHNNIFRRVDTKGIKVRTPEGILKLAERLEKQATPEYQDEQRRNNRETLHKIMDIVGMPDLDEMVKQLTDEQFDLLWFNPDFMTGQGFIYSQVTGKDRGTMTPDDIEAMDLRVENEMEESLELIRWALRN